MIKKKTAASGGKILHGSSGTLASVKKVSIYLFL
jgi:hypothetical protein